jgi:hypothetical protein
MNPLTAGNYLRKIMAYDNLLADRVRKYLTLFPELSIEEKRMFGGLAFMVNGKMCINVSGINLMCRFDPKLTDALADKPGFAPMIMKGKNYKGYCYVGPAGTKTGKDFNFWLDICLNYNKRVRSSKK